jgi:RNA polymerase-binding transcription factor DksA
MDTNFYKERLEEELKLVEEDLSEVGRKNPSNPDDWEPVAENGNGADENILADKFEELEENSAVLTDLENKYNDIKIALQKIADNTYGVCEEGGEMIEEDRLKANPAARTCKKHMN